MCNSFTKPNIFQFATKELSQDGFFTWLLNWADDKYSDVDSNLSNVAKDFIRLLIGKNDDYEINSVVARRQWRHVDIVATVNNSYFIVIEDKTNTGEHSKQLERYKALAEKHCKDKFLQPIFIYLKTGNESILSIDKVKEKGYSVVDRKMILDIFNKHSVNNNIFTDFMDYLTLVEDQTNSYSNFDNIKKSWKACEGFYNKLQEKFISSNDQNDLCDWGYVPNQSDGFLGFYYYWIGSDDHCLHIQIENAFEKGIKTVIKIDTWTPSVNKLYQVYSDLLPYAKKHNLLIVKPDRYRAGGTSTVAIIEDVLDKDLSIVSNA